MSFERATSATVHAFTAKINPCCQSASPTFQVSELLTVVNYYNELSSLVSSIDELKRFDEASLEANLI